MAYNKEFLGTGSCHSGVDNRTKTIDTKPNLHAKPQIGHSGVDNRTKTIVLEAITTIQLKKTTHQKLNSLGYMDESFDDVVNRLIQDSEEVDKYIQRYIGGAKGKCICKVIFGHPVIANHKFDINNKCTKCGIQGPIKVNRINDKFVIEFGEV